MTLTKLELFGVTALALVIGLGLGFYFGTRPLVLEQNEQPAPTEELSLDVGKTYQIGSMRILDGHLFDVNLGGLNSRYLVRLFGVHNSPVEAKDRVKSYLNKALQAGSEVTMVVKDKPTKDIWEVDIYIDQVSLMLWLKAEGLLYNR